MKKPPVQWRAPDECREWLTAQPGGISATLEMLVRAAMEGKPTARELELQGQLTQANATIDKLLKMQPSAPATVEKINPAPDEWGAGWNEDD